MVVYGWRETLVSDEEGRMNKSWGAKIGGMTFSGIVFARFVSPGKAGGRREKIKALHPLIKDGWHPVDYKNRATMTFMGKFVWLDRAKGS